MLFAVTGLLLPSRLQSPSLCPVETIAAPGNENGAERNRTAVRNTGVDHLVRPKPDLAILAAVVTRSTQDWGGRTDSTQPCIAALLCCPRVLRKPAPKN